MTWKPESVEQTNDLREIPPCCGMLEMATKTLHHLFLLNLLWENAFVARRTKWQEGQKYGLGTDIKTSM